MKKKNRKFATWIRAFALLLIIIIISGCAKKETETKEVTEEEKMKMLAVGKEVTMSLFERNKEVPYDAEYWKKDSLSYGVDTDKIAEKYHPEDIEIPDSKGYKIPGSYFVIDGNKDRDTAILLHGQSADRATMYDVAEVFLERGINVLAIDQRNSGKSVYPYITFGYLEKDDLRVTVNFVKHTAPDKKIILSGQSMGAATIGLYLGTEHSANNVDYAIMDSSYDNMSSMLKFGLEEKNSDIPFDYVAESVNKYMNSEFGFTMNDVDIVKSMKNNQVKTLIIQGSEDSLCLPYMGKDIYDAIPTTNKQFWEVPYKHVESIKKDKVKYIETIEKFIEF